MSFEMTKGLFKYDFTDQHAILGIPLDAEFNDIRKRYMKIARRLHSDTCSFESQADKDWANQFLSKVVNPAYNKFSKESDRKEYNLLLAAIGKRVAKEQPKMQIESEAAKQLATAKDWEEAYKTAVSKLALKQYESVKETQEAIDQISELNMVYLLRKERMGGGVGVAAGSPPKAATPTSTAKTAAAATPATPKNSSSSNPSHRNSTAASAQSPRLAGRSLLPPSSRIHGQQKLRQSNFRVERRGETRSKTQPGSRFVSNVLPSTRSSHNGQT
jgi:curved DNA-binding protein CbpA